MNLAIDLGNSLHKMAVIEDGNIINWTAKQKLSDKDVSTFIKDYPIKGVIVSAVVDIDDGLARFLSKTFGNYIVFNTKVPVPIQILYQDKASLGTDRLACAVAAKTMMSESNVLVIQLGSCIVTDFVNVKGQYLGGSISPGLEMRLDALHTNCAKLPKIDYREPSELIGFNTQNSILSGVYYGIVDELNGIIDRYKKRYPDLKIILSGGNANLFEHTIKEESFTFNNLVLFGLNIVLQYNV